MAFECKNVIDVAVWLKNKAYITETTDYSWKDGVQLQDM